MPFLWCFAYEMAPLFSNSGALGGKRIRDASMYMSKKYRSSFYS